MPLPSRDALPRRLEVAALVGFAFVLPLLEAPKNLLWLAWAGLWFWNRARAGDWGGPWRGWDTLLAAWLASGHVVAAFAGIRDDEWRSTGDLLRYTSVLWLVMRSGYGRAELRPVLLALIAGTAVTLAWGWWGVYGSGLRQTIGLKSVGHVNHSAIFLVIVFAALFAGLLRRRAALPALLCAFFAVSLFLMGSRAAVGALFLVATAIAYQLARRSGRPPARVVLWALLALALVLAARPAVVQRSHDLAMQDDFLTLRDAIWRGGLLALREHPVFGVGMGNYGRVTEELARGWLERRGEAFDPGRYAFSSHAHSLYLNTLVERGVFGLAVLLVVLGAWLAAVWRAPPGQASALDWAYWGGAAGAWLVAVLVGLVNTTLHHEHALASVLLLGGWLRLARSR